MCVQMTPGTVSRHKHNVMAIAERGLAQERTNLLEVIYDELAR